MKVNREQFLAAALLFASTTGCGKLSDRMKGEFNASQDPAVTPVAVTDTPGATPTDPASIGRVQGGKVKGGVALPVAKNGSVSVNAKSPISGPAKEGVGPASENIGPASENVGPAKEGWAPSGPSSETVALTGGKGKVGPSSEGTGPSNEGGWRRRGPANETAAVGPSNEGGWRPRPGGPSSETVAKPKPAPTVKPAATPKKV